MRLSGRAARDIFFNELEVLLRSAYTRHQFGISALVSQASFRGGNQWRCRKMSAFSQAKRLITLLGLLGQTFVI